MQKYYEHFNKFGVRKRCVCVKPGIDLDIETDTGVYGTRIAVSVAAWKAAFATGAQKVTSALEPLLRF